MGIRPKFYILVGVDDVVPNDPRLTPMARDEYSVLMWEREMTKEEMFCDEDVYSDWERAEMKWPGYSKCLGDYLYNASGEDDYAISRVVGLVIHKGLHDDQIVRALACIDQKYLESGVERIPTLDPDKHQMIYRHYGYTEDDVKNNMFVQSYFENMPSIARENWSRAQHYLGMVGWKFRKNELRYLLVWEWS